MRDARKPLIPAALVVAGLCLVSSAFAQSLKPIQGGDAFAVSPGNEIWRLPAGDTGGIGEMYTRPPAGGSLWGVATDKERNLYYNAARFAGTLVSGGLAEGFTGVLEVSSPSPFAVVTLRSLVNERGDFLITTFPAADTTRAAPSPMVFPQVAVTEGYRTEFVLLNAGASEKQVRLSFFDTAGKPAAVSTLVVGTGSGAP